MNQETKFQQFAEQEFANLFDKLIIPDDTPGGYIAFGKYRIMPEQGLYRVDIPNQDSLLFSNKRSAVGYCVADNYRQYKLANNIRMLDTKKHCLEQDIKVRKHLAHRSKNKRFSHCVETKIQRKQDYVKAVVGELEKCLYLAKYMQLRGFSNETARNVRTI